MEFWIQFSRNELNTIGNLLNKQYAINMNVLQKYNPHTPDNYKALAEETIQLTRLIKKFEDYGNSFPKKNPNNNRTHLTETDC